MNEGGRPLELTEELMDKAAHYASGGYQEQGEVIPSIAGLAKFLGKTRPTMYEWSRNFPRFSYIIDTLLGNQELRLLNGALSSELNANISKLILSKHGYSDKIEQDIKSSDGSMTPNRIEIVAPSVNSTDSAS
jgi:hypothetical protein